MAQDSEKPKKPTIEERRNFLKQSAAAIMAVSSNPAAIGIVAENVISGVATPAVKTLVTQVLPEGWGSLLLLKKTVDQRRTKLGTQFLDFRTMLASSNTADPAKALPQDAFAFLATAKDKAEIYDKIAEAYAQFIHLAEADNADNKEITTRLGLLLAGNDDFAVKLQDISRVIAADVVTEFSAGQMQKLAEYRAAMQKTSKNPNTPLSPAEIDFKDNLDKVRKLCAERPSLQQMQENFDQVYDWDGQFDLHRAWNTVMNADSDKDRTDPAYKQKIDRLIDKAVAETSLAQIEPEAKAALVEYLHTSAFWDATIHEKYSALHQEYGWLNMQNYLLDAISKATGEDHEAANAIAGKIFGRHSSGMARLSAEVFERVAKREDLLAPDLRKLFQDEAEQIKTKLAQKAAKRAKWDKKQQPEEVLSKDDQPLYLDAEHPFMRFMKDKPVDWTHYLDGTKSKPDKQR